MGMVYVTGCLSSLEKYIPQSSLFSPWLGAYMVITRSPLPQHQGELPLPLFGGNFWVILHDCIRQNYHKNQSNHYPFSSLW